MINDHLVIMAGGIGSRFWPMSTPEMPKQFIDILGVGKSLLQLTVERFEGVISPENIWVVTSKAYKEIVSKQLPGIDMQHVLLEPCRRNTAPCIAYVSYKIKKKYPHANIIFSPADHLVLDTKKFRQVISEALAFTTERSCIVTLGMQPTCPETGYGYIKAINNEGVIRIVEAFKEKPDFKTANKYIKDGGYFWNSGIFIWNVNTIVNEFNLYAPELSNLFNAISDIYYTDKEQDVVDKEFPKCENISIDYAIMERSDKTYVYPADFGWSDLGTWGSLYSKLDKDMKSNAVVGDNVKLVDCCNCVVRVPKANQVIIQGLDGFIVVECDTRLLICKKTDEQHLKEWC